MTKFILTFLIIIFFCSFSYATSIKQQIRDDGKVIDLNQSLLRWQPLWEATNNSAVKVTYDLKYGLHSKQAFDLYEPINSSQKSFPIIVFLHGGSFVAGDKSMYKNVGYHFAKLGITSIIMTYRLAPKYKWPSGTIDVANQLKWIRDNPQQIKNGDTSKVFLFGHSAGAQHAASYVFQEKFQIKNDGVIGAILASGSVYDTDVLNQKADPQYYDYFGHDNKLYPVRSVLNSLDGRKIPIFVSYAEYDKDNFQYQANSLVNSLYLRDKEMPKVRKIINHNHLSEVFHFNTGPSVFSNDIMSFIKSTLKIK